MSERGEPMDKLKDVIMEFLSPEANLFVYSLSFAGIDYLCDDV